MCRKTTREIERQGSNCFRMSMRRPRLYWYCLVGVAKVIKSIATISSSRPGPVPPSRSGDRAVTDPADTHPTTADETRARS